MKTVNLELSKKLKEAGYLQRARFFYMKYRLNGELTWKLTDEGIDEDYPVDAIFASPTADEILDVLPQRKMINGHRWWWLVMPTGTGTLEGIWHKSGEGLQTKSKFEKEIESIRFEDKSLADTAAKMYLYLKKEGLT